MELPKLTPLQFLVIRLLFQGERSGPQLRRGLAGLGVRRSPAAFSRLMQRLVWQVLVDCRQHTHRRGDTVVRDHRYRVTDLGVIAWKATREFFCQPPPPDDLVPVATEEGELAAYAPRIRKSIIRRRLTKEFPDLFPKKHER